MIAALLISKLRTTIGNFSAGKLVATGDGIAIGRIGDGRNNEFNVVIEVNTGFSQSKMAKFKNVIQSNKSKTRFFTLRNRLIFTKSR